MLEWGEDPLARLERRDEGCEVFQWRMLMAGRCGKRFLDRGGGKRVMIQLRSQAGHSL